MAQGTKGTVVQVIGTVVDVECIDNKIHKAELCKLPMYDTKGEIVRGIKKDIPQKPEPWTGIRN